MRNKQKYRKIKLKQWKKPHLNKMNKSHTAGGGSPSVVEDEFIAPSGSL